MSHFSNHSEENYLKTVYKLTQKKVRKLNNVTLAKALELNPATVLEMVRKLVQKKLLMLQADKSIELTEKGKKRALHIIRRHRLWEVFLVEKLDYKWNEVHDLAEQLEHIDSAGLVDRLELFLGHPPFDPHGDPIPDKTGRIRLRKTIPLLEAETGKKYKVVSFAETNDDFLQYLSDLDMRPGTPVRLRSRNVYDNSVLITTGKKELQLSEKVASNILVSS